MTTLAVLGLGEWGKNHARIAVELAREGRLERVILCDTDPGRLVDWPNGFETSQDPKRSLQSDVDAVDIVTPAGTHHSIARAALLAGKHVFVEKPMTLRGTEARSLARLAERLDLALMPGHLFRYHPAVQEIKAQIERGSFGDVRCLATRRTAFSKPRRDVGVLFSLGIHEADLYPFLIGEEYPTAARADCASFLSPEIDEVASIVFRLDSEIAGFSFNSWVSPEPSKTRELTVVGSKRAARVDYSRGETVTMYEPDMLENGQPSESRSFASTGSELKIAWREPLRAELEDFLLAVESDGKHTPLADAGSGCRAVEVIEALKKTGRFVRRRAS